MDDTFKIFVYRLKDGQQEILNESLDPSFLGVPEPDLAFKVPVILNGAAELAEQTLVLKMDIETEATIPCRICNQEIQVKIKISNFCFTSSPADLKDGVFDFRDILREEILLALPTATECTGDCPERASLAQYFSKPQK